MQIWAYLLRAPSILQETRLCIPFQDLGGHDAIAKATLVVNVNKLDNL